MCKWIQPGGQRQVGGHTVALNSSVRRLGGFACTLQPVAPCTTLSRCVACIGRGQRGCPRCLGGRAVQRQRHVTLPSTTGCVPCRGERYRAASATPPRVASARSNSNPVRTHSAVCATRIKSLAPPRFPLTCRLVAARAGGSRQPRWYQRIAEICCEPHRHHTPQAGHSHTSTSSTSGAANSQRTHSRRSTWSLTLTCHRARPLLASPHPPVCRRRRHGDCQH